MEILTDLLDALVRASLHGAVAIAAVWLVCRLFPSLPAALRCGLWWLACLKLLVALVWVEPIPLAILPAAESEPSSVFAFSSPSPGWEGVRVGEGDRGGEGHSAEAPPSTPLWPLALVNLWALGVLALLGLTAHQLAAARRLLREAEPVREPWLRALFAELRERLGVGRAELLASSEVETPQVSGVWRPRVLLPEREIGRLSAQELSLTLGHELLHVRRGDLWLGWVPALAQRLFFFHPLVWLAAREYAVAREAACDAAVLRALDPAPEMYGRLLLRLGVKPRVSRMAAAGAAPTFQTLKRRLEMLQQSADKKRVHPGWWGLLALLAVGTLIPFQMVAQPEPPPAPAAPGEPAAPAKPGEPAVPAKPGEPAAPAEPAVPAVPAVSAVPAVPAAPAVAPTAPVPPAPGTPAMLPVARLAQAGRVPPPPPPPAPPAPPAPPRRPSEDSYVLLYDKDSAVMSGSTSDIRTAKKLRGDSDVPLLWFERNGKEYVIRDPATLAQARNLFKGQMELGEKQGDLGEQQGKLGGEQGKLGAEMGSYGARIGELAARQASLALAGKDDESESLEAEMEELSEKMEALGRQMEALGEKQEVLGRQQEELGRQQEKLSHDAEQQLQALLDKAVASGLAKEADRY
jgi:bla regulator protein BlaR1